MNRLVIAIVALALDCRPPRPGAPRSSRTTRSSPSSGTSARSTRSTTGRTSSPTWHPWVAVVDSGIDADHPEIQGRIAASRVSSEAGSRTSTATGRSSPA